MHISLTPELEAHIKSRVDSGHYNNASEVVREALRFMITHEELVDYMKLEAMRKKLAVGEQQAANNQFVDQDMAGIIREAKDERNA